MNTELYQLLKTNGIAATVQRVAILEKIYGRRAHPSVDDLYSELKKDMPALSKTTVYSTLELFAAHHLIGQVHDDGGEVHYDGVSNFHAHFKCRRCGTIFDVPVKGRHTKPFTAPPPGFAVENEELTYYGICPTCQQNKKGNKKWNSKDPRRNRT